MTQIFLFITPPPGATGSFPDPGNWNNADNTIECVGCGSNGAMPTSLAELMAVWQAERDANPTLDPAPPPPVQGQGGGGGGGGGAYAKSVNQVVTAWPVLYAVLPSGSNGPYFSAWDTAGGFQGQDGKVRASIGGMPTGVSGGFGGSSFFPAGFAGGNGGSASTVSGSPGAGGGGAAGPHGAGGVGGLATTVASAGGTGDGGTVPGGAVGTIGNMGTQWDATHGVGSGGGGSPTGATSVAGRGANYGGGGGGGILANVNSPQFGGDGLIILTYTPQTAPPKRYGFNMPMSGL